MKLTGLVMITVLLLASFQGDAQTVNFSGRDIPLKNIFTIIKSQTGILFFYDEDLLKESRPVTVQLNNVTLETALNEIFKDQPLSWVLADKTVTISRRQQPATSIPAASTPTTTIPVRGTITDETGNPITDVTVMVKGKKQGTVADSNGRFQIITGQNEVLIFSSISHSTRELRVERAEMNVQLKSDVKPMETFIVGGNLSAIKRKADATAVTIIDAKTLEKLPFNTVDQIFRGLVPGTFSFNAGDAPEGIPVLNIRGTGGQNALGTVAVYIDGIEYAGGVSYLCQLDKTNIDRIEVVRGPGAATMYGTGSNGGIVQIFTKKGRTDQVSVNLTSSAGFYQSKWVEKNPFQQLHNLEMTAGFKKVVLTLGTSYRTVGPYLPDGGEKNKGFYLNTRINLGKLQATVTARYNERNFGISRSPVYDTAIHPRTDILIALGSGDTIPAYEWYNVRPRPSLHKDGLTETFIAGINLLHNTAKNWVNKLDAGYTTNGTAELPKYDGITPLQTSYFSEEYNTATIRYSNTLMLGSTSNDFGATILSGAEYKRYSYAWRFNRASATRTLLDKDPDNENFGSFIQINPNYKNVYLTLGLRYEKNELFKAALNPRLGITTNFAMGSLIVKPKISWGRGITAPSYSDRFGQPANAFTILYPNPDIKPQSQQGFDYGVELYDKKGKYKFEVVYYDNILDNMIGQKGLGPDINDSTIGAYISTNSAEIVNRGWEFSGEYNTKRFTLQANFSIMNSVVGDTTGNYLFSQFEGQSPGTRLFNLPKHVAGFYFTYNFFRLFGKTDRGSVSINLTEADGIKSNSFNKYFLDVAYGRIPHDQNTINYVVESSSPVFRLGFYGEYQLLYNLRFFAQGSNILNSYEFEYTNDYYATHGATWLFGFKYNFVKANSIK